MNLIAVKVYIIAFCKGCNYFISFIQTILVKVRTKSGFCVWREKVVFWAVFGKEFHLNDKWCFADRKEKRKELSGSISDEQILAGRRSGLVQF